MRVYLRWQKRKRFEYYKIIQLVLHTFTTTAFKSWPQTTISILEIATSNYDFNAISHLCKNVWNKVFPIIKEHESCLLARRDSFKSMKCEILLQMRVCVFYVGLIHYLWNSQVLFSTKIILKLGSTVPFTHLKIILL